MFEIYFKITTLPSFTISNLLLLKWRPFQYNRKFGKKVVSIDVFKSLLLKTLWENCFFKIQISFQDLLYCKLSES